jgi:hydrogenase nickel incorporation protein HypA/HybF
MTSNIVKAVLEEAERHNAKNILEVHLVIGDFTFLNEEQVKFSYQLLIDDTILNDSKLFIERRQGLIQCELCNYRGPISYDESDITHTLLPRFSCPICDGSVKIVEGKECMIKTIKVEV